MNIQELLSDPSIIRNEEGNILCIKIKNQREHHLNPQMVINESRMANEGWMIKRKPVANGNGQYRTEISATTTVDKKAEYSQAMQEKEQPLEFSEINQFNNYSNDPKESTIEGAANIDTKIKPKRKGGRPVGSKNRNKKK